MSEDNSFTSVICCAGVGERFGGNINFPYPKHLEIVNGKTLLNLTVEDAIRLGASRIVITCNNKLSFCSLYETEIEKIRRQFDKISIDLIPIETNETDFKVEQIVHSVLTDHKADLYALGFTDQSRLLIQAGDKPRVYTEQLTNASLFSYYIDGQLVNPFENNLIINALPAEILFSSNLAEHKKEIYAYATTLGDFTAVDPEKAVDLNIYALNVNDPWALSRLRALMHDSTLRPYDLGQNLILS